MVLTAVPFLAVRQMTAPAHAIVPLVMAGMSAGFVHGFGMQPRRGLWRLVFSPWTACPLMGLGWAALLAHV
jgi:predicted membrane protein